jgi:hypothetical protein
MMENQNIIWECNNHFSWSNKKGSTLKVKLNEIGVYLWLGLGLTKCLGLPLA